MPLSTKLRQELKGKAHKLKPIVLIGNNGLTDAVNKEIDRALTDHELIKVRLHIEDREVRKALFAELSAANQAELIQIIGATGVLYRKKVEK